MTSLLFSKRAGLLAALVTLVLALGMLSACASHTPATSDGADPWTELSLVHCDDGTIGYIDSKGELAIPCRFAAGQEFSDGLAAVGVVSSAPGEKESVAEGGISRTSYYQWGFIDAAGKLIIPAQFPFVQDFSEGLAAVQFHGKWGFIDKSGTFKVPARYVEVGDFHENVARAETEPGIGFFKAWSWHFIDRQGNAVIPERFWSVSDFHDGIASVRLIGKLARFIDHQGNHIKVGGYGMLYDFHEGLARAVRDKDNNVAFVDSTGKIVIQPQFENAQDFSENLAPVRQQSYGKWGYIDRTGKIVIPVQFDWAGEFQDGLAAAEKDGKSGYIDRAGRWALPPRFDRAEPFHCGVARVSFTRGSDISFLIDRSGRCLWNCRDAERIALGIATAPASATLSTSTALNNSAEIPESHQPAPVTASASDLFRVEQGRKTCYVSRLGTIAIPCQFDQGRDFSENLAAVAFLQPGMQDNYTFSGLHVYHNDFKWGFIDSSGNTVISAQYDDAHDFSEGFAAVRTGKKWRFIDSEGHTLNNAEYDSVEDFHEGHAVVRSEGILKHIKIVNRTGAEIADAPALSSFSDGLALDAEFDNSDACYEPGINNFCFWRNLFQKNTQEIHVNFFDFTGRTVIGRKFSAARPFHDGLAPARNKTKWGFIDHAGKFAISAQFDDAREFSEGLAAVESGGKIGFIERTGKFAIPTSFDEAGCDTSENCPYVFSEGLALVRMQGKFGYINHAGEFAITPQFDSARPFHRGAAQVHLRRGESDFDSLIDKSGHCFWNCPN